MNHVIGIDIGGTKTAAGVVSTSGELLFTEEIPTLNRDGGRAILDATAALVERLRQRLGVAAGGVSAVGVGSAGVIDAEHGNVLAATDAIAGWAGTPLAQGLAQRTGLPVSTVNDVHAHALGEAWLGAGAAASSMLMVAFGTGVGGSFVLNGRPQLGHRFAAGHVGHFASPYAYADNQPLPCSCGRAGHVEAIASGPAIYSNYLRLGGDAAAIDTKGVFARAAAGDQAAITAVGVGAAAAGSAMGGLINILDPELVVVSGGLADAGDMWWKPMERAMRAELMDVTSSVSTVPATLGSTAAILGAAALVLDPLSTRKDTA
ncbi:MAG: ROK family protein [Acidobacteria bacterium]|nr:ROK family protein [Acidobacteriota bacterium]